MVYPNPTTGSANIIVLGGVKISIFLNTAIMEYCS